MSTQTFVFFFFCRLSSIFILMLNLNFKSDIKGQNVRNWKMIYFTRQKPNTLADSFPAFERNILCSGYWNINIVLIIEVKTLSSAVNPLRTNNVFNLHS